MTFAAEWMRIAFMQFLSAEGKGAMGIKDFGEWKHYAFERFKCILDLVVKNAANRNRVEHSDLMFRLLRSNARIPLLQIRA
jgi:hypothetical protein